MPQLGANDDVVQLNSWKVARGQKVTAGEVIAELETTKAIFELEAETSGYLYPITETARRVPVRTVLARPLKTRNELLAKS